MTRLFTFEPHEEDHHHEEEIEEQRITPAMIFEADYLGEPVPEGFDAVRIPLNGRVKSSLSWTKERDAARNYAAQGLRLFWEIDLGFYQHLEAPIGNTTQFLSLCLSLEHFRDTLWKEFSKESVGLCLFRGPLDFMIGFPWDEEQTVNLQEWMKEIYPSIILASEETGINLSRHEFVTPTMLCRSSGGRELVRLFCRNAIGDYLTQLAAHLPDTIPLYALFDASTLTESFLAAELLSTERFPALHIGVKGEIANGRGLLGGELGWEGPQLVLGALSRRPQTKNPSIEAPIGVCLPKVEKHLLSATSKLKEAVNSLAGSGASFKIIPEGEVLMSWDGLERLVVDSRCVDKQLFRVLQGFAAAGGTVSYLENPLGISGEEKFLLPD